MRDDKTDSARVRVEGVMREEANLEVMEILDLFLELLIVRIPLIESSKDVPQASVFGGGWRKWPSGGGEGVSVVFFFFSFLHHPAFSPPSP